MDLDRLRRNWENLGRNDPMWAILTAPGTEGGRWNEDAFFQTGRDHVAWLGSWLGLHKIDVPKGDALDFGCGIGRLTQALAPHFASVTGVDISAPMIDLARAKNRFGERVRYAVNTRSDLSQFGDASFAFVHSVIVLQHIRSDYVLAYLREFLRVLRPGGLLFAQLATENLTPGNPALASAQERPGEAFMEVHSTSWDDVLAVLAAGGADLLLAEEDRWAGEHWRGMHFAAAKR
jgi:SAM-dependent methyltransferase